MGWFWRNSTQQDDPTKKLAPELQDYLKQETPTPYTTSSANPSKETPTSPSKTQIPPIQPQPEHDDTTEECPKVPAASLFQDGRYAHLWKTYKPLAEIEATLPGETAQRVVDQFKSRKDSVHAAAMVNCAIEHEALSNCFSKGTWWDMAKARSTMCAAENRKFSRCYTTQAKFLQALGYAGSYEWDDEKEERIQMHADKLYHQMLDYENQVAEARAAGREPPPITSLFNPGASPVSASDDSGVLPGGEQLPEGYEPSRPLKKMTPHERELEIQTYKASIEQKKKYADAAAPFINKQIETSEKRRERATSWFGETIGKWIT